MLPVLLTIGPVKVYTFGFLLGVGIFLFAFLAWRRLRDLGIEEEKVIDFLLLASFWAFIVSRLGYILVNFRDFGFFILRWLLFGRYPGFSFWGFFLGGLLVTVWFSRRQRWQFWQIADELVFSLMPLTVLFHLGLFFNAGVLGAPTSLSWGFFSPGDFVRRQPVALFAAIAFFLIWVFLLKIERRWRTWSWYQSQKEGLITLILFGLAMLSTLSLAFLEEGGTYYLWFKRLVCLSGLFLVLVLFFYRAEVKIKAKVYQLKPLLFGLARKIDYRKKKPKLSKNKKKPKEKKVV
jgi:phosphatidylglycerol:prolipoprotein diacylglycerol transferase